MSDLSSYLNFDPVDYVRTMLWAIPALFVLSVLSVALHEIGHAVVGAAVGIPVRRMQFGRGEGWTIARVAGVRIVVTGRWPLFGFVRPYTYNHVATAARAAFFAGGIAFNLLGAGLALALFGVPDGEAAEMLLFGWVYINLIAVLRATLGKPTKGSDGKMRIPRDGARLAACFRADANLEAWRKAAKALLDTFGEGGARLTAAEARAVALGMEAPPADPATRRAWVEEVDEVLRRTPPGRAQACLATLARASLTKAGAGGFETLMQTWPVASCPPPVAEPATVEAETI